MSSTPSPSPTPTPLLPLLLPYISTTLRFTARIPGYLASHIPWTPLLAPLNYLLAPITTFISILFTLTLFTPYNFISWFLDALFPVYVLCGVACITGGILGLGGRLLSMSIVQALSRESAVKGDPQGYNDEEERKGDEDPEVTERSAKRRRLGRKERVKFEPT